MKFQILIPTYNRVKDLQNNLLYLKEQIVQYNIAGDFGIVVSDNASTDHTWNVLEQLKKEWEGNIQLEILRNEQNVGLEQNAVNLLQYATADYIIWLGDDDLLADGYLQFAKEQFEKNDIGWMIPGLISLNEKGEKKDQRPVDFLNRKYPKGYPTVLELSHLGHQMSGLIVCRKDLVVEYLSHAEWRTPYLFIFFLTYNQFYFDGWYALGFKTIVNSFNQKDWTYNEIGLLDEVFKSYYYLKPSLTRRQLNRLMARFVQIHSYRINFSEGLLFLLKQWRIIVDRSSGTSGLRWPLFLILMKEYLSRRIKHAE